MAAGRTYTPIATYTVTGSAAASYTFSSIPSTYTDLVLISSCASDYSGTTQLRYKLNGLGTSIYSGIFLTGDGTSAASSNSGGTSTFGYLGQMTNSSTEFGVIVTHINNYSNATTYKTLLSRSNYASGQTAGNVSLAQTTQTVNSILLQFGAGNIRVGSTFTLYGIAAA